MVWKGFRKFNSFLNSVSEKFGQTIYRDPLVISFDNNFEFTSIEDGKYFDMDLNGTNEKMLG